LPIVELNTHAPTPFRHGTVREFAAAGVSGVSGSTGSTGATGVVTTTTVAAPTTVHLTGFTLAYGIFTMADGTVMLLPEYVYSATPDGASYTMSFRVVPIDPQYIDLTKAVAAVG
jgi:hypothetical protein